MQTHEYNNYTVRELTKQDVKEYIKFRKTASKEQEEFDEPTSEAAESLVNYFSDSDNMFLIGVFDKDTLIAQVTFSKEVGVVSLNALLTLRAYQNQGIATHLIDIAKAYAKKEKIPTVELIVYSYNTNAKKLYEKLNFRKKEVKTYYVMESEVKNFNWPTQAYHTW